MSTTDEILSGLVNAWLKGRFLLRVAMLFGVLCVIAGAVITQMADKSSHHTFLFLSPFLSQVLAFSAIGIGAAILAAIFGLHRSVEEAKGNLKIEVAEERLRANPEEPQLAWDVAREKLERYLNRNLSQVRSIFLLTVFVMLVGFALIAIGAYQAFHDQAHFSASVLSAVSGVVVSFIGGTFLVLYKATMEQASNYVTILERINAVGMSVQILKSLEEDPELRRQSTAEVAKQLLRMYSGDFSNVGRSQKSKAARVG
ncbi:TRADD-N-associated membrane domain-containing protein [Acidicapsa ligni]|uniref:TRADD-N-associated membrane domain-containing protein n=1 Tax=Acidicapsa ligni TaxID=542300 RepID=UPI0021DF655E|nr:hypothetical protein [Acidicapsa ligni]